MNTFRPTTLVNWINRNSFSVSQTTAKEIRHELLIGYLTWKVTLMKSLVNTNFTQFDFDYFQRYRHKNEKCEEGSTTITHIHKMFDCVCLKKSRNVPYIHLWSGNYITEGYVERWTNVSLQLFNTFSFEGNTFSHIFFSFGNASRNE